MKSLVIIPTYNEIENIKKIVHSVLNKKDNFDVLIVDDSSPDGTSKAVEVMQKDYENRLHLMIRKGKNGLVKRNKKSMHRYMPNIYLVTLIALD